ncbi:MAG: PEP-CTERM system histidine kinase PrsK, partial [Alphaproteobacteria bacterium]|nr:PEP-CTERM system histidine kinase PrsK [Alphaproteobacteria bacterium]
MIDIGYALAAAAFLAILPGVWRLPLMAGAVLVTAAWAGAEAWRPIDGRIPLILEAARTGAWLAFLFALLGPGPETTIRRALLAAGVATVAGQALFGLLGWADGLRILLVLAPVLALLLIENLYRNGDREGRWAVKYLCFGLGMLFAYDFFLWADAALLHRTDPALFAARGFVDAMA